MSSDEHIPPAAGGGAFPLPDDADQALIQLVQEKSPDELTEAEVSQLQQRLRSSPALRAALIEQLQFEGYLNAAFSRYEVSVEQILSSASVTPVQRSNWFWGWPILLLLALGLVTTVVIIRNRPRPATPAVIAEATDTKPAPAKTDKAASTDKQPATKKSAEEILAAAAATDATDSTSTTTTDPAGTGKNGSKPTTTNSAKVRSSAAAQRPSVVPGLELTAGIAPPPFKPWRGEFEAEQFVRGNARIDTEQMGRGIGVIYSDDPLPAFVEYEFAVPQTGVYQLDLRYAAQTPRPLKYILNGQPVFAGRGRGTTRDWQPADQTWFPLGEIELSAGHHCLRIESDSVPDQARQGQLPAIDKWALASRFTIDLPAGTSDVSQPEVPWRELVQAGPPAPPASQATHAEHGDLWGLCRPQFQNWFEPVPGISHQLHDTQYGEVSVVGYEGVLKLRAPTVDGAVLRLSAFDHFGMRLHFWNGKQGITLHYSDRPSPWWGAYATTRTEDTPRPTQLVFINSDEGRYDRSTPGPFEIRYENGLLIMHRGTVRLLSVPFEGPPRETYLDGRGWLRGVAMYRSQPLPEEPVTQCPIVLRSDRPADLPATSHLPKGAALTPHPDGRIELSGTQLPELAKVSWSLAGPGLYEVRALVDAATPGTGLFLADLKGQPAHRVGFFKERQTQGMCLGFLRPNENHDEAHYDPQHQIVPFTGQRTWIRLVLGQGSLKCWMSADGEHWGRALEPLRSVRSGFRQFGLYCLPGDKPRSITLKHIEIRELHGLMGMVPAELLERVPQLSGEVPPETWLRQVVESQPPSLDTVQWRQACALRTLPNGPGPELGRMLLGGLVADVIARPISPEDRLRCLADAALWSDTWDHQEGLQFAGAYELLGQTLAAEGHPQSCELASEGLLNSPLWTTLAVRATPDSLIRTQLTQLLYREDWPNVTRFITWARFWNRSSHPHQPVFQHREPLKQFVDVVEIAALRVRGETPRHIPNENRTQFAAWRHPLIEQLSKEGYNILAELEAALTGQAYRDACQIIVNTPSLSAGGLLPDTRDPRLFVSLPRAVRTALIEHPPLQQTMIDQFSAIGRLRVRQAIAEGNAVGVQLATVQFSGTDAAAEAALWLGDRALSAGQLVQANGLYKQALSNAGPLLIPQLQARQQLVQALAGQSPAQPEPVTIPVTLGQTTLSPAEFTGLLGEFQNRRQQSAGSASSTGGQPQAAPLVPASWRYGHRLAFDGDAGQHAGAQRVARADVVGREMSLVTAGNWLLMSNRFQVAAYELHSGQLKWRTGLGGQSGDARSWSGTPCTPVVRQDRVYVRRLTQQGFELACLELATGKVLWNKRPGTHVLSDPLFVQDDLFAITADEPQFGLVHIALTQFEPATGEALTQTLLTPLRDAWGTRVPCQAVVVGDQIVATLGGCSLSCNVLGQVRWLRQHNWLPPSEELGFIRQFRAAPVVHENRVFLAQPGVNSVECLDLESGRLIWRRAWSELRRIVGWNSDRLIVETDTGWEACLAETGELAWSKTIAGQLEGCVCPPTGPLLMTRVQTLKKDRDRLQLVWLDSATGLEVGRWTAPDLIEQNPQLGTVLTTGDRLWLAYGKQPQDFRRELIELVPTGAPAQGAEVDHQLENWTRHVATEIRNVTQEFVPGWTFVTSLNPAHVEHQPQFSGEQDVVRAETRRDRSVVWLRRITLPAGKPSRLSFAAALGDQQSGTFVVKVNDQTTWSRDLEAKHPDRWVRQDIDLAAYAGQTVWLQVAFDPFGDGAIQTHWKRMQVE